ncbi:MAG: NAD(P)H-dependent oxidoreductase [Bacteroidaceae bacterium]|nr:NAD(P)H-dependent oxidoreductase [Bacteroidaceae bacterium]
METKSKKVVILLAHPNIEESKANKNLIETVKKIPNVEVYNLYNKEIESFDNNKWATIIDSASSVIFQFPFYWAAAPSRMKEWIDQTLTPFSGTPVVNNKPLMVVTTTGSDYDSYRSGGRNKFTIDELLRPYQLCADHSCMIWQTPLVVYGIASAEASNSITVGSIEYKDRIKKLLKD